MWEEFDGRRCCSGTIPSIELRIVAIKTNRTSENQADMIIGIFEAAMLVCFAASWPFNLRKAYRARTNVGTSIFFMSIVLLGYLFGVLNKIVNEDYTYVLAFYLLDIALVSTGVIIYIRNRKYDEGRYKNVE